MKWWASISTAATLVGFAPAGLIGPAVVFAFAGLHAYLKREQQRGETEYAVGVQAVNEALNKRSA